MSILRVINDLIEMFQFKARMRQPSLQ